MPQGVAGKLPLQVQPELSVQDWLEEPLQAAPPQAGVGLVQVRVWVPVPQVVLQAPQADQPPLTGVLPVQAWLEEPLQAAPPQAGVGLVQVLVWVPGTPQALAEQELQGDQSPLTGWLVLVHVPLLQVSGEVQELLSLQAVPVQSVQSVSFSIDVSLPGQAAPLQEGVGLSQ